MLESPQLPEIHRLSHTVELIGKRVRSSKRKVRYICRWVGLCCCNEKIKVFFLFECVFFINKIFIIFFFAIKKIKIKIKLYKNGTEGKRSLNRNVFFGRRTLFFLKLIFYLLFIYYPPLNTPRFHSFV